jgi:hypothetical protein
MVSGTAEMYALSTLDILVDISGLLFRLRSLNMNKNLNIGDEHGTGSLDPYALTNKEHTYNGTFTYASFLVDGTEALKPYERLLLQKTLLDQNDEGRAKYFDIYAMEVPGHNSDPEAEEDKTNLNFIAAAMDCKVTKFGRDFPDKDTIVSSVDFKYTRGIPK